MFLLIGPH